MINTRLIWAHLPREPFVINNNNSNAIALCNTEARYLTSCPMREHGGNVEFLEEGSRRTRIAIKTHKNDIFSKMSRTLTTAH